MKTPITYYGGKQTLLKYILPLIPKHSIYTESFRGGAAVFFSKYKVDCEVINDINDNLVNFYNTLQLDYEKLKSKINATLHSRTLHGHAAHILAHSTFYSHIERAWAIWVLSKMSFASMLDGSFGYDFGGGIPKKLNNAKDDFSVELSKRLESVTIENRDAIEVIKTYDTPNTFHFVDPPYVGSDCGHYEGLFGESNLIRLLDILTQLEGKFMLTMFPHEEIAKYAKMNGWIIHKIERTISASKTNRRKQEEWIVCNYNKADEQPSLFN